MVGKAAGELLTAFNLKKKSFLSEQFNVNYQKKNPGMNPNMMPYMQQPMMSPYMQMPMMPSGMTPYQFANRPAPMMDDEDEDEMPLANPYRKMMGKK